MRAKAALCVLMIVCALLAVGLWSQRKSAESERTRSAASLRQLSNEWSQSSARLATQIEVNTGLTNTLREKEEELDRSNKKLSDTVSSLSEARAATQAAQAEIAKRDAKIADLESQNAALDQRAKELQDEIGVLDEKISDIQRKLAASEGNREFLLKELKRLQSEKGELERQFNDVAVLKERVRKLKADMAVARRIEWAKKGLSVSPTKGAARLREGFRQPAASVRTNYDLEVEMRQDGSARVVPSTNAPAPGQK